MSGRSQPLRRVQWLAAGVLLAGLAQPPGVWAHESRPAHLEITETTDGRYDVVWRTPLLNGVGLPVAIRFSDGVRNVTEPVVRELSDSRVERRVIDAGEGGLAGKRIEFVGLQVTITDVLVRIALRDRERTTTLVHPSAPWIEIAAVRGPLAIAAGYLVAGIHHILLGVDHLLFVLGLLLIVRERWMLVKAISAFTVAHSLTLAVATLGYASVPAEPLNATIALSILFLAPEIVRSWRGETSLTLRHPWMVAFAFGLLHGFGFASGLNAMGLPRAEIPLALLMFNVGVETGQLLFVVLILGLERAFRVLEVRWPRGITALPAYTVGSLGAFWTIQRVVLLLGGCAMRRGVRGGCLSIGSLIWLVSLLWAPSAHAHILQGEAGGLLTGLWHPVSGLDHVLAMIAVGVWGAQLGAPALWLLPVTFPMVMALGGMLGLLGVSLPGVEVGIATSGILLGLAVTLAIRPPMVAAAVLVGTFGIFHGQAHGAELPAGQNALLYSMGFVVATGSLHAVGIAIGSVYRWSWGQTLLRTAGAAVAVAGVFFMWRAVA